ncbi:zf-HC2 domain-containing protein [Aquabacterium sp. OR-4]|uniref:anti-sigma factor family protein n=1 Tax=Aquabacterium sp. OR-4 TaxID=2978127 RepID=UPI0021B42CC4|nr:zf-HC2 domain-containing protein [Aquabacterium sp. OR-4]MDT7837152.1 zf-HC2 domain-containing protein [Aquabacterium sp. OR-4]
MALLRSCRDVTALVLQGHDRPLRPLERLSMRLHWLVCPGCRNFRRQARVMGRAMDGWRHYRGHSDE